MSISRLRVIKGKPGRVLYMMAKSGMEVAEYQKVFNDATLIIERAVDIKDITVVLGRGVNPTPKLC